MPRETITPFDYVFYVQSMCVISFCSLVVFLFVIWPYLHCKKSRAARPNCIYMYLLKLIIIVVNNIMQIDMDFEKTFQREN